MDDDALDEGLEELPAVAGEPDTGDHLDLDAIETDLADVEIALARLESGEYWTCEITGRPLTDELLVARPTARRLTDG